MTAFKHYGTPAHRAVESLRAQPIYSQEQQRERRRAHLLNHYSGAFDLTREVSAICSPLTARVAGLPRPGACWREVDALAAAVHELAHVVVGLVAERDARRKTAHLSYEKRGRSIRALVDLAERPALPEIDDDALVTGTWVTTLIALAEPYSASLADVLAHALPPGTTRGALSASQRLEAALRVVDTAALTLERLLDRAERSRETTRRRAPQQTETDRARAELAALGIDA